MANEIVFEINAADMIAKLHLGGVMACDRYDKNTSFIVNTGIIDDDPNAKPDSPGKVKFNLDNSQGTYELGFVTQLGPYGISTAVRRILPQINEIVAKFKTSSISNEKLPVYDDPDYNFDGPDYKMTDELAKSYSEVMRLMWDDEKNRKDLKEDDNIDFQQIAEEYTKSKIEEIDTEIKKIDEQLKKSGIDPDKAENSSSEEDDGKDTKDKKDDDKDSVGSLSKRKTALAKIKEQCEKIVADPLKIELYLPVPTIAFGITQRVMTAISDASKNDANSEKNIASQKKARSDAQTLATNILQKYMNVFAGPEAAKSFNEKDIIMIYVTQDAKSSNDKKLVDYFQILPISDAELEKHMQQHETDPSNCTDKVCFKMGFKVSVDK